MTQGTGIPNHTSEFVQYVADNVDHNLTTLDGNDTFHGMGLIATVTPGTKQTQVILRRKVNPTEVSACGKIQIQYQRLKGSAEVKIRYRDVCIRKATDPTTTLDVLWKISLLFGVSRPALSGMMQFAHRDSHPGQSSVVFLPMINMSSSNTACIFSTLKFISEHARHHKVTPIITFDQPLWWKAFMVIESEPADSNLRQAVLRLRSFHTEMTFIGSIGQLIAESGLKELLELIYAPNAVEHILTGKAIARAVRAHLLFDAVLNTLILSKALGVSIPDLEVEANAPDMNDARAEEKAIPGTLAFELQEAHALYADLMARKKSAEEVSSASAISKIKHLLQQQKKSLQDNRTSKLWLQYMDMVDILRKPIKAERTGHWVQHFESLSEMLPYMAAGHSLYTKSAQLYL